MALKQQSFEAGTAGAGLSTTNPPTAGSDSAASAVSTSGTAAMTVSSADAQNGSQAMETTQSDTTASVAYFRWSGYSTTTGSVRFGFKWVAAVPTSGTQVIFRSYDTTNGRWLSVQFTSAKKMQLAISSSDTVVYTSAALSADTWYGVELQFSNFGDGTTNLNFNYYTDNYTTPADAGYSTTTGATGSGTSVVDVRYGRISTTSTSTLRLDNLAFDDTTATAIGPVGNATNAAPVANAGSDQSGIEPFATVTLDGTGSSDSDGTVASYSWSQTAGTTVALSSAQAASPTFTAPPTLAGSAVTFALTVTDNGGASSTPDSVTITVLPHTVWRIGAGGTLAAAIITKLP